MDNWDDLRFFLAVAKQGSVSAAATKLGVNHSTVSRRIRSFEDEYGVRLFERLKSGVRLTQSAENILESSGEIERIAQAIGRSLVGGDARLRGKLTLTMPSEFAADLLIGPLAEFQESYPDIDLHLSMAPGLRDLAAREADLAVRLGAAPPPGLDGEHIAELSFAFYASQSYLQDRPAIDRVIRWEQSHCNTDWAQSAFPGSRTTLTVDVLGPMIEAVRSGMGIARLPVFTVRRYSDIVRIDASKGEPVTPSGRSVWVLTHPDMGNSARLRVCKDFVVRALRKQAHIFHENG